MFMIVLCFLIHIIYTTLLQDILFYKLDNMQMIFHKILSLLLFFDMNEKLK